MAKRVVDGDVIGVGSGSTAFITIKAIGDRIREEKLNITAIPTSYETNLACTMYGIPTTTLQSKRPSWHFDGADEVDKSNNFIKGRGGAMFKEKLNIISSPQTYILVDDSKFVDSLGEKHPIPIEVFPSSINLVAMKVQELGAQEIQLRLAKGKDGPVITEAGNMILDVRFKKIENYLEKEIKQIPGVIETGLFIGYKVEIIKG